MKRALDLLAKRALQVLCALAAAEAFGWLVKRLFIQHHLEHYSPLGNALLYLSISGIIVLVAMIALVLLLITLVTRYDHQANH